MCCRGTAGGRGQWLGLGLCTLATAPPCDIQSIGGFFTGPWTVIRLFFTARCSVDLLLKVCQAAVLIPTISVSPSAAGCGGQDIQDPSGINLHPAPPRPPPQRGKPSLGCGSLGEPSQEAQPSNTSAAHWGGGGGQHFPVVLPASQCGGVGLCMARAHVHTAGRRCELCGGLCQAPYRHLFVGRPVPLAPDELVSHVLPVRALALP